MRTGFCTKRTRSSTSTTGPGTSGSGPGQEVARRRARALERAGAGQRGRVEAPRRVSAQLAGREVAGVERLQRMLDDDAVARTAVGDADRAIDHIEQLTDRDRGRTRRVRALVLPAVGDQDPVAGGHERVEQELAVLEPGVVVAHVRVVQDEVVAVSRARAREDLVVEAEQADHAVRDRTHRHERADGEVAGAEVRARGAAAEAVGQKRADVRQLQGRRRRLGVCRRLREDIGKEVRELLALPGVAGCRGRQGVRGFEDRVGPHVERLGSCESVERVPESVDQLREAAREVDVGAADVVERQDAADEPAVGLGRGDAD